MFPKPKKVSKWYVYTYLQSSGTLSGVFINETCDKNNLQTIL